MGGGQGEAGPGGPGLLNEESHQWLVTGGQIDPLNEDHGAQFSGGIFYLVRKEDGFGMIDKNKDREGDTTTHRSGQGNDDSAMGCGQLVAAGLWGNGGVHVLSHSLSRKRECSSLERILRDSVSHRRSQF